MKKKSKTMERLVIMGKTMPKCDMQVDGTVREGLVNNAIPGGLVCKLSKHKCYTASSYFDCYCLLAAGLCPRQMTFVR